jgi:hypothetical protein
VIWLVEVRVEFGWCGPEGGCRRSCRLRVAMVVVLSVVLEGVSQPVSVLSTAMVVVIGQASAANSLDMSSGTSVWMRVVSLLSVIRLSDCQPASDFMAIHWSSSAGSDSFARNRCGPVEESHNMSRAARQTMIPYLLVDSYNCSSFLSSCHPVQSADVSVASFSSC